MQHVKTPAWTRARQRSPKGAGTAGLTCLPWRARARKSLEFIAPCPCTRFNKPSGFKKQKRPTLEGIGLFLTRWVSRKLLLLRRLNGRSFLCHWQRWFNYRRWCYRRLLRLGILPILLELFLLLFLALLCQFLLTFFVLIIYFSQFGILSCCWGMSLISYYSTPTYIRTRRGCVGIT